MIPLVALVGLTAGLVYIGAGVFGLRKLYSQDWNYSYDRLDVAFNWIVFGGDAVAIVVGVFFVTKAAHLFVAGW
ncbi:hypothetical protein GCM10012320_35740 [Sinomonas cellulolyticus]|uniref:Uncharacterized protein n=1 Tax=Sinomonas cellulolyticus TaxID=2801916 RepID=A0ABS1K5R7_9MICC|nr:MULTISPECIES: hypothetical protein [Sinomonas]MBL0706657.1 hypothetical protein [Sinomonas cellulolyticus]GHG60915.1 hypothetical protein GCM10012320_35740 [Sinomonas sp. KCTC 49339]